MSQNARAETFESTCRALVTAMRPYQWFKNTLVFGGFLFSNQLLELESVRSSVLAFVVFTMAASAVYLLNDIIDLAEDQQHPVKCHRPIASGQLPIPIAVAAIVVLWSFVFIASLQLSKSAFGMMVLYLLINLAYTLALKRIPVLDVMAIGGGFVLRIMVGIIVIGGTPSPWVVLCVMMLALYCGFGKRRHELSALSETATKQRLSESGYSVQFLDMMMGVTAAAAVVTYALFTVSDDAVSRFRTYLMVFTTPLVVYGLFRYLFLVYHDRGGDPAWLFLSDVPLVTTIAAWLLSTALIVNTPLSVLPWWATKGIPQTESVQSREIRELRETVQRLSNRLEVMERTRPAAP